MIVSIKNATKPPWILEEPQHFQPKDARLGGFRKTKLEPKDLGGGKELNIEHVLSHGGTPKSSMFFWIFHDLNHPFFRIP
jgi:hypothetical protein